MNAELHYVDTHCHLEQDEFRNDLNEVIARAKLRGIHCISSAISPQDWNRCLDIASKYDNVYASIGLDPMLSESTEGLQEFASTHRSQIIAIGEVGLDYYREREHPRRERQQFAFIRAIELANEYRVPLQVHSRSAGKAALNILETAEARNVQMHAFDGKASLARRASNELGFYFSIPTSVVRSPQKQKLVKAVNIERLLLETDSPVLSPILGERNEPSNVILALDQVAEILHRDKEEMRLIVLENTLRLYKRMSPSRYS